MPEPTSPPGSNPGPNLGRLRDFVAAIGSLVSGEPDEGTVIARGTDLLAALVAEDDWLPDAWARPDPERYQQHLLHADAQGRFSVVSFVWGPGQSTPIHDHRTFGLIGVLRGAELATRYSWRDGRLEPDGAAELLGSGEVDAVSPRIGDIHQVANAHADRTSISIHVYGADIGAVHRNVYRPTGEVVPFVSGYANDSLPNIWGRPT